MNRNSHKIESVIGLVALSFIPFSPVRAAQLEFASAAPIILTIPSTTLTIASGSVADSLTVNATSVVVGMSGTTGGTFTLNSPDYSLTVTQTNAEATPSLTCATNLVDTLALSQASGTTTYTVTPGAAQCTVPAISSSSNPTVPSIIVVVPAGPTAASLAPSSMPTISTSTPATASSTSLTGASTTVAENATSTNAQLETLLAHLEVQLQSLLKEAAAKGIAVSGMSSPVSNQYNFTRDLTVGDRGEDVNALQEYLIKENKGPAAQALAKYGTTDYFGPLTKSALIELQKEVGIHPTFGYFGSITRNWIATHA